MRAFIARSPFLCLGTSSAAGADVTPRGDAPGFVQVLDEHTLLLPDWPGNNRLDTLGNVLENPAVALLFFVPGMQETLRVNGRAEVSIDPALIARWDVGGRHPRSVLKVTVDEAFMHCGKALIRSRLWAPDAQIRSPRAANLRTDLEGPDQAGRERRGHAEVARGRLQEPVGTEASYPLAG